MMFSGVSLAQLLSIGQLCINDRSVSRVLYHVLGWLCKTSSVAVYRSVVRITHIKLLQLCVLLCQLCVLLGRLCVLLCQLYVLLD